MAAHSPSQSGNILFLILLAVVLFAALSYAVTSSTRGGGNDASKESLLSQVSTLENSAISIRTALQRMTVTEGYKPWQIDYSKAGISNMGGNATCTANACRLYNPAGGGVTAYLMPAQYWQSATTCPAASSSWLGRHWFRNTAVKGIGTDALADLTVLYAGISDELCRAVNDKYGVINPASGTPFDQQSTSPETLYDYSGTLSAETTLSQPIGLGDGEPSIAGKHMFCARHSACNYLWMVVYDR